jgi:hypothetical protein
VRKTADSVSLLTLGAELREAAGKIHIDKFSAPMAIACFCAGAVSGLAPALVRKALRWTYSLYIR